jgi:hypothetical protein
MTIKQTYRRHVVEGDRPKLSAAEHQATAERLSLAATQPSAADLQHADRLDERWRALKRTLDEHTEELRDTSTWQKRIYRLKMILPKTRETNDVLARHLLSRDDLFAIDANQEHRRNAPDWMNPDAVAESHDAMRTRPLSWIVGTSLLFEGVILAWAAWLFCRRDF